MPDPTPVQPQPPNQADQPAAQPKQPAAAPGGKAPSKPAHHSAHQPRDDGKRFAGPPARPEEGQEAEPPTEEPLEFRFQENGQEVVERKTRAEVAEELRLARAIRHKDQVATQRFQRAGQLAKESEEARAVAKAIEEGDYSKLRDYYAARGKQPVDVLAGLLEKALDERDMDPKDRELAQLRAEKAAFEEEQRQQLEDRETHAFMQQVEKQKDMLHNTWGHVLEQKFLPKNERVMDVAASIFMESLEATGGKASLSPEQVAELTRWELIDSTSKPLINGLEVPQFLKHFSGEGSIIEKIDKGMSAEDFLKAFPGLADRFHRHLVKLARSQSSRSSAPRPRAQSAHQERPNGEKREIMLPSEMMNHTPNG
jgi:hypothetical protein